MFKIAKMDCEDFNNPNILDVPARKEFIERLGKEDYDIDDDDDEFIEE